eukprot:TRINITY_DN4653_c0_g1_i1.p1 TRINITY_DN4653_c0_g1~~TRINITY_DN4653_c0_g1_i1.p1  ORF type:complete len:219 (+),score=31.87 TRINITY_DN4653_c0_g1_i1:32-688(+)
MCIRDSINAEYGVFCFYDKSNMEEEFEEPEVQPKSSLYAQTKHPVAVFFHIIFKIAALVLYLFAKWFLSSGFVTWFIVIILILAADFWTVKNVTGRLLVGLRWWHYVKEDGSNVWVFESAKERGSFVNSVEGIIFWASLVGVVPIWTLFGIVAALSITDLEWVAIDLVAIALTIANIVGYARCIKDKRKQLKGAATGYITNVIIENATKSIKEDTFQL